MTLLRNVNDTKNYLKLLRTIKLLYFSRVLKLWFGKRGLDYEESVTSKPIKKSKR